MKGGLDSGLFWLRVSLVSNGFAQFNAATNCIFWNPFREASSITEAAPVCHSFAQYRAFVTNPFIKARALCEEPAPYPWSVF